MKTNDNHQTNEEKYIKIGGKKIYVTKEVYRAYKQSAWAENKRRERDKKCIISDGKGGIKRCTRSCRECDLERAKEGLNPIERNGSTLSLDQLIEDGYPGADHIDIEEFAADKLLLEELYKALEELDPEEYSLIKALYFDERTHKSYSDEVGCSRQYITKQNAKVLKKLAEIMKRK